MCVAKKKKRIRFSAVFYYIPSGGKMQAFFLLPLHCAPAYAILFLYLLSDLYKYAGGSTFPRRRAIAENERIPVLNTQKTKKPPVRANSGAVDKGKKGAANKAAGNAEKAANNKNTRPDRRNPVGLPAQKEPLSQNKKTALLCAGAFLFTLAVTLTVLALKKVFPFGEKSLFFSDMSVEYLPFFSEFYDKIRSGDALSFSWATALGGNYWGTFAFYAASPLNYLLLLFSRTALPYAFCGMIVFKQALAAASMTLFLSVRRQGKTDIFALFCGVLYAYCGWFTAYYFNTIWLDAFYLLPLLALGIERLADRGCVRLYIPVLMLTVFSNFYFGILCCAFCVIYFFFYLGVSRTEKRRPAKTGEAPSADAPADAETDAQTAACPPAGKTPFFRSVPFQRTLLFAGASVFSALMLAFFLVPLFLLLRSNDSLEESFSCASWFRNIPEQVAALFTQHTGSGSGYANYANIYAGILPLCALPQFFLRKRFSLREKLISGAVLLLFVLSFNIPLLDYIWHGFRYPTAIPFRESLFFSFFLLLLAHRGLSQTGRFEMKSCLAAWGAGAAVLACGIVYYVGAGTDGTIGLLAVISTGVLLIGLPLFLRVYSGSAKRAERALIGVWLALLIAFDAGGSMYAHIGDNLSSDHTRQSADYTAIRALIDRADDTAPFYRSELRSPSGVNNGAYYGFRGVAQASSAEDTRILQLLRLLGNDSNRYNETQYFYQTPLFDAMMGVKYLYEYTSLSEEGSADQLYPRTPPEGYTRIGENERFFSFRFSEALPLGYAVSSDLVNWQPEEMQAPQNQESFFRLAAGADPLLRTCDLSVSGDENGIVVEKKDGHYTFDASNTKGRRLWLDCTATAKQDGALYLCVETVPEIEHTNRLYFKKNGTDNAVELPYYYSAITTLLADAKAGEKYTVYFDTNNAEAGEFNIQFFQVDTAALKEACSTIRSNGTWLLTEAGSSVLKGDITIKGENRLFMTTIPANDGWEIKVDGALLGREQIVEIGGAFIAFPIEAGKHEIEMRFRLPGVFAGGAVSLFSLAAGAVYLFVIRRRKNSNGLNA